MLTQENAKGKHYLLSGLRGLSGALIGLPF